MSLKIGMGFDDSTNLSKTQVGPSSVVAAVIYSYLDQYTTALAAGSVHGTPCEPGPGTRDITDAETKLVTSGGVLSIPTQANDNYRGVFTGGITMVSGLGFVVQVAGISADLARMYFGTVFSGKTSGGIEAGFLTDGLGGPGQIITTAAGVYGMIRSASGYSTFIQGNKIVWVSQKADTANCGLSAMVYFKTQACNYDNIAAVQFGEPFQTDYALATQRIATNQANDTITQSADALVTWTFTAETGVTKELSVRYVDADNRWVIRLDQAAGKIYLYERNAGVETERGATGGTALVQTNGTAYRVMVIMDTQTIHVCAGANNAVTARKVGYTSASFNQTATTAKASHAGTNFISYPRSLTGAALTEYQRVYPF